MLLEGNGGNAVWIYAAILLSAMFKIQQLSQKSTSVDADSLGGSKRHKHKHQAYTILLFFIDTYFTNMRTSTFFPSQTHATSSTRVSPTGNEVDYVSPGLPTNIS